MKLKTTCCLIVSVILFVVCSTRWIIAKPLGSESKKMSELDRLPDDAQQRDSVLKQFYKERQNRLEMLLTSLGSDNQEVRYAAAYVLGRYRYEEAVRDLAKQITMESSRNTINKREPRWGDSPAVEALIRIGKPSVREMLENIESSKDAHVRGLSARVIYYIEGPKLSKIILEDAIEKQKDPAKKKRLKSALLLLHGDKYVKPKGS